MDEIPTFVTQDDLLSFVYMWGWVFPLSIVISFLWLYNRALKKRNKEVEDSKKNLMNVKHRSNGVKNKVHE